MHTHGSGCQRAGLARSLLWWKSPGLKKDAAPARCRSPSGKDGTVDVIQQARNLGARIRRKDRRLQVVEFQPAANNLEEQIRQHIQSIATQVTPFVLALAGTSVNLPLPAGIDLVKEIGASITVGMQTRPHSRNIHLRIGAWGDRCVLYHVVRVSPSHGDGHSRSAWEEVAWFDPAHPPEQDQVASWVNQLLLAAMKTFEED
jgi:hypothetical protein